MVRTPDATIEPPPEDFVSEILGDPIFQALGSMWNRIEASQELAVKHQENQVAFMQGAANVGVPIDVMRKLMERVADQHGEAIASHLLLKLRGGLESTVSSSPGPPPAPGAGGVAVSVARPSVASTGVGTDAPATTVSTGSGGDGGGGPPGRDVGTSAMPEMRSVRVGAARGSAMETGTSAMPEMRSAMVGTERGRDMEVGTQAIERRDRSTSPDFMTVDGYGGGPPASSGQPV